MSEDKDKLGDKSKKVASYEEAKREKFGGHLTDLDEDINLWVTKRLAKQ